MICFGWLRTDWTKACVGCLAIRTCWVIRGIAHSHSSCSVSLKNPVTASPPDDVIASLIQHICHLRLYNSNLAVNVTGVGRNHPQACGGSALLLCWYLPWRSLVLPAPCWPGWYAACMIWFLLDSIRQELLFTVYYTAYCDRAWESGADCGSAVDVPPIEPAPPSNTELLSWRLICRVAWRWKR